MKAFVHRANNNFFSSALFQDPNTHEGYVRIGHLYHDYYGDYGFGFWSCKAPYEYELTTGVWDEWFTEVLTYDPSTGYSTYSINGATPLTYIANPLNGNSIQLLIDSYGWYTGHYTKYDYIKITQETNSVPEPTAMLLLGLGLVGVAGIRKYKI